MPALVFVYRLLLAAKRLAAMHRRIAAPVSAAGVLAAAAMSMPAASAISWGVLAASGAFVVSAVVELARRLSDAGILNAAPTAAVGVLAVAPIFLVSVAAGIARGG